MTRYLLVGAIAATVADAIAYVALITSGHVAEGNPLVAAMPAWLALLAKVLIVVVLFCLPLAIGPSRFLTTVLVVAIAVGMIGATSTVLHA